MSSGDRNTTDRPRDPDFIRAEAAMRRAARRAQQRARDVASAAAQPQRNEKFDDTSRVETTRDPRKLTFSQAQGYEEIPGPLKLEELPRQARTHIWNVFYHHLDQSTETRRLGTRWISGIWQEILRAKHMFFDNLPLDEWSADFGPIARKLRGDIERMPFNKVFDLLQFVFRHPKCPPAFIGMMMYVFAECRLAYNIDEGQPATIIPSSTEEEGNTIIQSLKTLREAGLRGSAEHLRRASECINENDWPGSIRESIHAVESVARQIAPDNTHTLTQALNSIDKHAPLHSLLKEGIRPCIGTLRMNKGFATRCWTARRRV